MDRAGYDFQSPDKENRDWKETRSQTRGNHTVRPGHVRDQARRHAAREGRADHQRDTRCRGRRDRQRRQIRVFSQVVTFLNSNMRYITNLPGENAECLFHGPVEVFEHISGVPPVIVMDNACLSSNKSACREVVTFC